MLQRLRPCHIGNFEGRALGNAFDKECAPRPAQPFLSSVGKEQGVGDPEQEQVHDDNNTEKGSNLISVYLSSCTLLLLHLHLRALARVGASWGATVGRTASGRNWTTCPADWPLIASSQELMSV